MRWGELRLSAKRRAIAVRRFAYRYRDVIAWVWLAVITLLLALSLDSYGNQQDSFTAQQRSFNRQQRSFERQQVRLLRVAQTNRLLARQLCRVVVNVHEASLTRVQSERRRLESTLDYLRTLPPAEEHTNLSDRVRANLPSVRADVQAAAQSERATRPPSECARVAEKGS